MTGHTTYRYVFILTTLLALGTTSHGQRISFGTWAGTNISIQEVSVNTLDFGNMIKGAESSNSITLSGATAFQIMAPEGYDLTVSIDAPMVLDGPGSSTIPFSIKFAYSNQGAQTSTEANPIATEVPSGFTSVTFPVRKSAAGVPAPPPPPPDATTTPNSRIKATAFLFLYGSAGPAGSGADSGEYTGTVNILVEYSNY